MMHEIILFVLRKKWDQEHGSEESCSSTWLLGARGGMNAMLHPMVVIKIAVPSVIAGHSLHTNATNFFGRKNEQSLTEGKRNKELNRALEERHRQFFLGLISSTRFQDNFLGTTKHSVGLSTVGFLYCTVSTTKASSKHSKPPIVQPLEQKITRE